MATSSMHKPGWRSRRRSRLSLVERAVPLLGRPVEDGAKTARGGETRPPSDSTSLKTSEAETKPVSNGDTGPAQLEPQPRGGHDHTDHDHAQHDHVEDSHVAEVAQAAPVATWDHVSKYVSDQISDDGDRASPVYGETEAADDAAAPDPSSKASALTKVEPEASAPPANLTPSAEALSEYALSEKALSKNQTTQADMSRESSSSSGARMAAASVVARINADKIDAGRSSEQAPPASSELELDWDRLIDSGFTDPRDRGRPLSKKMDEIVRALIRQALSDQSSWRDRVILVTSPYERTGKTTAAINFAFGLTTVANHHVVMVDVDTKGTGAVDRLGGGDRNGITTALVDESVALDEVVIRTDLERLTLVASGDGDEETLDHFASRRMLQILRHLTENPDTILIIDAPPILLSQEAAVLSVIAGQVVLAVEAGETTADQIEHALQRIGERHNVSLVLNECSGVAHKDRPRIASRREPAAAQRKTPSVKRRLPKTAAAGAFVLSLLVFPPTGQTGPDSIFIAEDPVTLTQRVLPPERWSNGVETTMAPVIGCAVDMMMTAARQPNAFEAG